MADIRLIEVFDDSNVLSQIEKVEKSLLGIGEAGEQAGAGISEGLSEGSQAAAKFDSQMGKTAKSMADGAKQTQALNTNLAALKAKLGETINGFSVGGKTVSEWRGQLSEAKNIAKDVAGNTEKMTVAQKIFNTVIKLSPLGILAGLLGSVIAYFTRFQAGIDKASQVVAAATGVFDKLIDRVSLLGKGVLTFLSGNFSEGISQMSGAFSGLGAEIANTAQQAFLLEEQFQRLRDAQIAQRAEIAKQSASLERLKEIGEDESLTYRERIKALKEAGGIESSLSETRVGLARKNFDLVKAQNAILSDNVERRERLADAEIELIEAEAEAEKERREIAKTLREIRKEQEEAARAAYEREKKRIDDLKKQYEGLVKSVNDQNEALAIDNENNPVERVNREWRKAIAAAEGLRSQLYRLAPTSEDRAFAEQQISELFGRINLKYSEELEAAREELEALKVDALNPLPPADVAAAAFEARAKAYVSEAGRIVKDTVPELQAILEEIAETFNLRGSQVIDVNEARQLFAGLRSAFDDAYEGYSILNEVQLELSAKKVEQLEEQVEQQESAVEREKRAAEAGLANNLALEQRKLQELQAQRRKAAQDRLNLERKAATQQLIIDSAQQGSSLATMAANIVKAESNKGLLGVAFAISAIAFMFKVFAQAKANSLKLSEVPKLRKGARLEGPSHESGGVDIYVNGKRRYEAEGKEWLIGTAQSIEHDKFLGRLNKGEFKGVNLDRILSARNNGNPYLSHRAILTNQARERREVKRMEFEQAVSVVKKGFSSVVDAIESQPVVGEGKAMRRAGNVTTKK